jgi:hypothetical protein
MTKYEKIEELAICVLDIVVFTLKGTKKTPGDAEEENQ